MARNWWQGKTAVVCGASAGLGKELASQLARQRATLVALVARDASRLALVHEELAARHPAVRFLPLAGDLCHTEQVRAISQQLSGQMDSIDLVVQAVGQSDRGTLCDLSAERYRTLLDTNLTSSLNAIQHFQPLVSSPGGTMVLIGSLASHFAPSYLGGYAMAKHALAGLAQQARLELASEGIHVLLACPGPIARSDAGTRYNELATSDKLPPEALQPGGGTQIKQLEPQRLARDILKAAAQRKCEIIRPRKARLLLILSAIFPRLGDLLLKRNTS